MVLSNPNTLAATGRSDRPYSGLDVPKYTPYKDGKGQLDFGMTPIKLSGRGLGDTLDESIFDIDKYWPFYINQKNWLLDNCRSVVYQDLNKKKTLKAHREMRSLCLWHVADLEHRFPHGTNNPNWDDWGYDSGFFERVDKTDPGGSHFVYRNYFGGPFFKMWREDSDKYGLEELARGVQEDLCILRRTDDGWILRAAAVCFPSYWSLHEKMGKPLKEIHGPVPQMHSSIDNLITKKLDELKGEAPVERFNWTLTPDMQLHQPSSKRNQIGEFEGHSISWKIFIRTERQTFMKLPNNDILFTIRTYLNSLVTACQDKELALGLQSSIMNSPIEVLEYRGIDRFGTRVIEYIDRMWNKPSGCAGFHN
jgi:hypothetical protein